MKKEDEDAALDVNDQFFLKSQKLKIFLDTNNTMELFLAEGY